MLAAMRTAREVTFSAYVLRPGKIEDALVAAFHGKAIVHVRLEGHPYRADDVASANRDAVRTLKNFGIDASLVRGARGSDGPVAHIKAAVCDGTAFLDDRNWNQRGDTVIRDTTPSHVLAVREAVLTGRRAPAGALAVDKRGALRGERSVFRDGTSRSVDVETEYLGVSVVSGALRRLAKSGGRCRLLISDESLNGPSRKRADSLARAGVDVRVVKAGEKLAVAPHAAAWVGSANATSDWRNRNCSDWGLSTRSRKIVDAIEHRFNENWKRSTPLPSAQAE